MSKYRVIKLGTDGGHRMAQVVRLSDGEEMLDRDYYVSAAKRACDFLNEKPGASSQTWMLK